MAECSSASQDCQATYIERLLVGLKFLCPCARPLPLCHHGTAPVSLLSRAQEPPHPRRAATSAQAAARQGPIAEAFRSHRCRAEKKLDNSAMHPFHKHMGWELRRGQLLAAMTSPVDLQGPLRRRGGARGGQFCRPWQWPRGRGRTMCREASGRHGGPV